VACAPVCAAEIAELVPAASDESPLKAGMLWLAGPWAKLMPRSNWVEPLSAWPAPVLSDWHRTAPG
jgi:hypothetical protein